MRILEENTPGDYEVAPATNVPGQPLVSSAPKIHLLHLSRVEGLAAIPMYNCAWLLGAPVTAMVKKERMSYTGKICEVVYNCFGDFKGFVLESCCERHSFIACEKGIAEIVCERAANGWW